MNEENESNQLENLFKGWVDIFSKESERPFITHKDKQDDSTEIDRG